MNKIELAKFKTKDSKWTDKFFREVFDWGGENDRSLFGKTPNLNSHETELAGGLFDRQSGKWW